jgi:hypothetical protein
MRHGRWKSVQIARRYIRQGARWDDNPRLTSDRHDRGPYWVQCPPTRRS